MQNIEIKIELATNEESRVSAETLTGYVLRALAGVTAANRAMVVSYSLTTKGEKRQNE